MSVDRTRISVVGGSAKAGALSTYSQTPAYAEGRDTPMYAAGSRTPMYGSQTPQYDGSRTPHYGGMTPSHDGSRTPGQSGAWDPTVTNTPARSNDYDDYFDEASPSPAYNPATPGSAYHAEARRTVPTTRIHRTNQVRAQLDIKLLLVPLDMLQLPVRIREFLSILLPVLHPATHHRHP